MALETAAFAHYRLGFDSIVYNNIEGVMDFPLDEMYSGTFRSAVEWIRTETVEGFGADVHRRVRAIKADQSVLYIADSLDAMVSEAGKERAEKKADGKKADGTYGTEKAKYLSAEFFNNLLSMMADKDFTLLLISQVRENLNAGLFGKKFYRTGGKALDFYTHQVAWLYHIKTLEKEYHKRKKAYGVQARMKVDRNKVAPPYRTADFQIHFNRGVDDVGAMCDYLGVTNVAEIKTQILGGDQELYDQLAQQAEEEWAGEEEATLVEGRPKYE